MPPTDCERLLSGLNPAQRRAAAHLDGPCLVLAGAGSGKTRVLTHRVAYLICRGVAPQAILAITFTNKAAREMRERVVRLVGDEARDMWISTFHAACVRILRRWGDRIGYDRGFVIRDEAEQRVLIKASIEQLGLDPDRYPVNAVRAAIDHAKNELRDPDAMSREADSFYLAQVARIYAAYQERLRDENALDFGDLLMQAVRLLREHPEVLAELRARFSHLLVDEYQDTNHAQYVLLKLLAEPRRNLFAVGDADQSIYGWRGADIRNILRFEEDFPEAEVVLLEQNYRSTRPILDVAHDVIAHNRQRREKRLWTERTEGEPVTLYRARDEREEAEFVAGEILRLRADEGLAWQDFAVLYRTHAQSRVLEEVFVRRGLPYVIIGGQRFYERQEVKDLLAYLRLVINPYDSMAFERVLNRPRRGLGATSLLRLTAFARDQGISLVEACCRAGEIEGLQRQQAEAARAFGELLARAAERRHQVPVAELLEELIVESGYERALLADGDAEAIARHENLRELVSIARGAVQAGFDDTVEDFLAQVALTSEVDQATGGDAVALMTLHSAKGLEFPVVFLVGLEEGLFPHVRSLDEEGRVEEERRLCYVGMTRAEQRLYLTHAWSRMIFGDFQSGVPSRFLSEIAPGRLRELGALAPGSAQVLTRTGVTTGAVGGPVAPAAEPGAIHVPRAGEQVRHPKWGVGTVVGLKGDGGDAEIAIAFPGAGVKRVIARYARLEPA
ncbi:MAG TPA: UvrD-helicase domain-containing protein [Bacillota bacterium]